MPQYAPVVQIPSVLGAVAKVRTLQNLSRQQKLQEQEMRERDQKRLDDGAILQAVRAHGGDIEAALPAIRQINPFTASDLEDHLRKSKPQGFELSPGASRYDAQGKLVVTAPARDVQPQGFELAPGASRYDARGNLMVTAPAREVVTPPPSAFTLSPGQTRYGPDGTPLASIPAPVDQGVSDSIKRQAEVWRQTQLQELEKEFTLRQPNSTGLPKLDRNGNPLQPMTTADLDRAKAEIQKSYLSQLGLSPKPKSLQAVSTGAVEAAPSMPPSTARPAAPVGPGGAVPSDAVERRPIPGHPGSEAELRDGRWIRVK